MDTHCYLSLSIPNTIRSHAHGLKIYTEEVDVQFVDY